MTSIVEQRVVAVGYVVRVLTDESESRVCGNLGKNTLATVTSVFGQIVEVENSVGIRQYYPEEELQILRIM
jgi:hypothetical protein